MTDLRVSLVQSHLLWEDKAANFRQFEEKLLPLSGQTDLIILPEMFSTGFSMNASVLAEDMDGATIQWLKSRATETGAVVTGSFIARENGRYFNRLVWMSPDGHYHTYDKHHLFTLAGEQHFYSPGKEPLLVKLKAWKIMPLICYDLRFPVWSRNTKNYDLLIFIANFPEKRSHAWQSLLLARAIENQAFTIGLNRVGKDGNGIYYSGDSRLIDFEGKTLYGKADIEDTYTATLSFAAQKAFRAKLPFLDDRDAFLIK